MQSKVLLYFYSESVNDLKFYYNESSSMIRIPKITDAIPLEVKKARLTFDKSSALTKRCCLINSAIKIEKAIQKRVEFMK